LLAIVLLLHGLLLAGWRERLPSPRPGPLPAPAMWTRPLAAAVRTAEPVHPQPAAGRLDAAPSRAPAGLARTVPSGMPVPAARKRPPADGADVAATIATLAAASAASAPASASAAPPASASAAAIAAAGAAGALPATDAAAAASDVAARASAGADADADTLEPANTADGGSAPPRYAARLPGPALLRFQLRRGPQHGQALLRWQPSEDRYTIVFDAQAGQRLLFEQRSAGRHGPLGLAPERFQDKRRGRAAQHATFDTDGQRIAFTARAPDLPLWPGAQDRLGWIVQLAAIVGAASAPPDEVTLFVVGARGGAGPWTFVARGAVEVATPLGPVQALHYERAPAVLRDQRVEAWLDPARGHWPVRLRFTPVLGGPPLELLLEGEPAKP
jgi:hypothetical protein